MTEVPLEERPFLDAVLASPTDDGLRRAYADWLEEQGDGRARYLRAEVAWAECDRRDHARRDRLSRELVAAREGLDVHWVASVSRSPIAHCDVLLGEVEVGAECPAWWEECDPTDDARVRYCNVCRENVHAASSIREAVEHFKRTRRIAVRMRAAEAGWSDARPESGD